MTLTKNLMLGLTASACMTLGATTAAHAVDIVLEPYVTGVNAPLAMVQPAGDDRKFVIEQYGRVRIIDGDGNLLPQPFLDIRNKIVTQFHDFDERGLLGLAFHPDFANNGKFYVAYSRTINFQGDLGQMFWWDHTNTVSEYTVSADDSECRGHPLRAHHHRDRLAAVQPQRPLDRLRPGRHAVHLDR